MATATVRLFPRHAAGMRKTMKNMTLNLTDREIERLWDEGNNEGNGYSVGGDKMTPREAAEDEGFTDIRTFDTSGSTSHCVIARDGGDWVAICDANGPWAVTIHVQGDVIGG
jgi:hypothetical protein